jgi:hypothetical protein
MFKLYHILTIAAILLFIANYNKAYCDYLDESLVAYWSFDDSTARDYSGNGYNGIIKNSPSPAPGLRGSCFYFHGKNTQIPANGNPNQIGDHIVLPKINFDSLGEFTISLFIKGEIFTKSNGGDGYIWFGDHDYGWLGIGNVRGDYNENPLTTKFSL